MVNLKRNTPINVSQRQIDNAVKLWESTRNKIWKTKWYELIRIWHEQKTKT